MGRVGNLWMLVCQEHCSAVLINWLNKDIYKVQQIVEPSWGLGSIDQASATHLWAKMKICKWDQCPHHWGWSSGYQSRSRALESSISASLLLHWYQWLPRELWRAIGSRSINSKEPSIGICNCPLSTQTTLHQLARQHQKLLLIAHTRIAQQMIGVPQATKLTIFQLWLNVTFKIKLQMEHACTIHNTLWFCWATSLVTAF